MNKATFAKLMGWGQLFLASAYEVYKAGGVPQTADAWFHFIGSVLIAVAVHHASETSAGHPNGAN